VTGQERDVTSLRRNRFELNRLPFLMGMVFSENLLSTRIVPNPPKGERIAHADAY